MAEWEACIGMEVHAELLTESKMFCSCANAFGGEPNSRCCPVCTGMPGSLPVMNKQAVEMVLRTALALNCEISMTSIFHRKNYFYPDLPKNYQISQYGDTPIGKRGWLDVPVDGRIVRVHIRRVHLEEDTGKLFHLPTGESAVDYNRSGVPLMEIVTEFPPDMHTAEEARAYLQTLRSVLVYLGVCDGRMEQGSLRCEPNLSVRPKGSDTFGVKTELKNLNSFRAVQRGIEYEIQRHIAVLEAGGKVVQETRGWNDERGESFPMRTKEYEQDYRYFPEPDLVPVQFSEEWIEAVRASLPELPLAKRQRFMEQYALPAYDATLLVENRATADYFEEVVRLGAEPKAVANWMNSDLARLMNAVGLEDIRACKVQPQHLRDLIGMVQQGTITGSAAKQVLEEVFQTGTEPAKVVQAKGLTQVNDAQQLLAWVQQAIAENPDAADKVRNGKMQTLQFLVGQVMKLSRGRANPNEVRRLIAEQLGVTLENGT